MTDMPIMIENINAQTITPALGKNPRQLYEHQEEAIRKLDAMDKRGAFRNVINLKRLLNGKQNVWKYQNGEEKSDSDEREKDI